MSPFLLHADPDTARLHHAAAFGANAALHAGQQDVPAEVSDEFGGLGPPMVIGS